MKDLISKLESLKSQKFGVCEWGYTEQAEAQSFAHYEKVIEQGLHGPLGYLADQRKNIRKSLKDFYPEFQSALVFLFDYRAEKKDQLERENPFKLASYVTAFEGEDYHYWIAERLDLIARELGLTDYKISLDIHPVLERDLAFRTGLGWFGKNSMLISREHGSYFLIASLLLPEKLNLAHGEIETDHCGTCTACIDQCPTDAIDGELRTLDSAKCISTFTIELFKDSDPPQGYESRNEVFGCDICQEVCPWNNKPLENIPFDVRGGERKDFLIESFEKGPAEKISDNLDTLSNRGFKNVFKRTSVERTGRSGMIKNFKYLKD